MIPIIIILAGLLAAGRAMASDAPVLLRDPTPPASAAYAKASRIAELGRKLFFDPALSASGRMACSSCHDPAHGFSAPNGAAVQLGGPDFSHPGTRAVPSLTYGAFAPAFSEHFFESEEEGDESVDQGPTGGRDWDGRVDRARDQAFFPLFNSNEMANASRDAVVAAVARAGYANDVRRLYGRNVFTTPATAFAAVPRPWNFISKPQRRSVRSTVNTTRFCAGPCA